MAGTGDKTVYLKLCEFMCLAIFRLVKRFNTRYYTKVILKTFL